MINITDSAATYSFTIRFSDEDEGYIAECPEFPGLSAFGSDPIEAMKEGQVALELFIEAYREEGKPLPEPLQISSYSGQLRLRLPRSLHRRLALMAETEGVSLNTLMVQFLAEGVGGWERRDVRRET